MQHHVKHHFSTFRYVALRIKMTQNLASSEINRRQESSSRKSHDGNGFMM